MAERDRLLEENQGLFILEKRILRDGAYVNDAAKTLLIGDENVQERWQKKADGIWDRLTVGERDVILRIFARREANTRRIVEIQQQLLPDERLDIVDVEKGWQLPGKRRQRKDESRGSV